MTVQVTATELLVLFAVVTAPLTSIRSLIRLRRKPVVIPSASAPEPVPDPQVQTEKEYPVTLQATIESDFDGALAFIEKAAPGAEASLVADAKAAIAAAKAAFTPVADAAAVTAVGLITSKFAMNAPFSAQEIAILESVIAKLQAMIPA